MAQLIANCVSEAGRSPLRIANWFYRCILHFDIRDGKIWLQQNLTDRNPAEELVMMGVPREDIVLGLQAPYKRQYTDYGVA